MQDAADYVEEGTKGKKSEKVDHKNVASKHESGALEVYATPAMIGLMEAASVRAVDESLPEGWITVGLSLDVKHIAPTPKGKNVTAESTLIEIQGRKLVFDIEAYDDEEKVGIGKHERFCVSKEEFMKHAENK